MKNFLCIFYILVFTHAAANNHSPKENWLDYWTQAVFSCTDQDFEQGIEGFTQALYLLNETSNTCHDYIYVDRGRAYLLLDRLEEALTDFDFALSRNHLAQKDLTRALVSKIAVLSRLERNEENIALFNELKKSDQEFPKTMVTEDYVIIRNMPDSDCYHARIKDYLIYSGLCENLADVQILPSGICIAKKKASHCEYKKSSKQNGSNNEHILFAQGRENTYEKIGECQRWCDKMAIAGTTWCGRFKTTKCQTACALAVDFIKECCYWCCDGEGFYRRCIKPFEDISKYIQPPCDPMWD